AKGKYVSPVPIEARLASNPIVEQVCVMGTGLRAPVGVVVLSPGAAELSEDDVAARLNDTLLKTNAELEGHERLAAVAVCREQWTIENDCLTPTMKTKRNVLEQRYLDQLKDTADQPVRWLA
ncbi:MAG: AMP-dependent synthetase, partial [Pseudomonadota bacterium]